MLKLRAILHHVPNQRLDRTAEKSCYGWLEKMCSRSSEPLASPLAH